MSFPVKKLSSSTGRFANATLVRLSEFLSAGYKKGVRPVKDWRTSTIVAIDLMVYSILNVVCYSVDQCTGLKSPIYTRGAKQIKMYLFCVNNLILDFKKCYILLFMWQDEKNQVLTTYVWYRQVGRQQHDEQY